MNCPKCGKEYQGSGATPNDCPCRDKVMTEMSDDKEKKDMDMPFMGAGAGYLGPQDSSKAEKKFKVYCWCEDGQLYGDGCCDGAFDEINAKVFDTKEKAENAGEEFTHDCGPWRYEVKEIKDE